MLRVKKRLVSESTQKQVVEPEQENPGNPPRLISSSVLPSKCKAAWRQAWVAGSCRRDWGSPEREWGQKGPSSGWQGRI